MRRTTSLLRLVCITSVVAMTAIGCGQENAIDNSTAPAAPSAALQQEVEIGLGEIDALTRSGDSEGVFDAANDLVRRLDRGIVDGELSSDYAVDVVDQAAVIVAEIDVDIHIGTDEKCDASHQCVKGTRTCVSVTWHDGNGGGRNCYNFGGKAGQKIK